MFSSPFELGSRVQIARTTQVYYLGWIALAMLLLVDYCGARFFGLTFIDQEPNIIAVIVLIFVSLLFYGIFGRSSQVGAMVSYLALWIATLPVTCVFTYLLASLGLSPIDSALDQCDKAVGFDWLSWYKFVNANSAVKHVLIAAYASMSLQIVFSIIYFSHIEEANRSNELWWTASIALVITTIVSGILPAMGTFEHYGVIDAKHGAHLHDLYGLRGGTLTGISMNHIQGIITLPSYHTVLAVLLSYIYRDQRRMLYVVLPLNLLMLISIPSQGGHYLADMFAGGAVAALSIWIVARIPLGANRAIYGKLSAVVPISKNSGRK